MQDSDSAKVININEWKNGQSRKSATNTLEQSKGLSFTANSKQGESKTTISSWNSSWDESLLSLQTELDPQIFQAYIKPLKATDFNQELSELTVSAPSSFVLKHVNDNFKNRLAKALEDKLGIPGLQIRFAVETAHNVETNSDRKLNTNPYVVVKRVTPASVTPANASLTASSSDSSFKSGLNPKYTFSSFVVGNNNQFCHAAALRVAEAPGTNYNPLFIYGGVGLGKTHLLHAIGNAIVEKNPSAKVLYMSSETFTNELIQSLRYGKMEDFKNKLRTISVLLIDDIQFMCGKDRTQEEFFHTFNTLYGAKNQIVLTSDKMPQEIPGIEDRLKTRFSWGLTADLLAPDFETRVAILKKKALLENITLAEDTAHYVAENIVSNVRELEGALTRLLAMGSIQKVEITKELAISALKNLLQPKQIVVKIDDIKGAVAQQFNIKVSDMVSKRRTRNLSFPRHIAMYLCRKHTTASYPEIGLQFGGRDHSSVIHAANVVSAKLAEQQELIEIIRQIEERLFRA